MFLKRIINKTNSSIDFLHGTIADKLIYFAIPLAVTGFIQQLFSSADVAMLGRYVGKTSMAAVGSNSMITSFLLNLFIGISLGANIIVSHHVGKNDEKKMSKVVHTVMVMAILCGVCIIVLGELITVPMLNLLAVDAALMDKAVLYLRIYILGMPFLILYNFEAAIFRGKGDAQKSLICMIIMGISKVLFNYLFLAFAHADVGGVALSTIISNAIGAGVLFIYLAKSKSNIRLRRGQFRIDTPTLRELIRVGLPAGLQMAVFALSNLVLQSAINSLGVDAVAASSAAFNIEMFAYYVINAFGQACSTHVGQNYGAGNETRCRRGIFIALLENLLFTMIFSLLMLAAGKPLLMLFNTDPGVIRLGMSRLTFVLLTEWLNVIMEVLSAAMRGYGCSMPPAIITLVGVCGTRLYWVYGFFQTHPDFSSLMMVFPTSWLITAVTLCAVYLFFFRTERKKYFFLR